MQRSTIDIPINERHCLTIAEAAAYFLIGQDKLREIIANDAVNTDGVCASDCVLYVGKTVRIKRKLFENWVDKVNFL